MNNLHLIFLNNLINTFNFLCCDKKNCNFVSYLKPQCYYGQKDLT